MTDSGAWPSGAIQARISSRISARATLFFLRFWRDSRDRLFAFLAWAFVLLAVERLLVDACGSGAVFFVIRLLAFVLIIIAIIGKNRAGGQRST